MSKVMTRKERNALQDELNDVLLSKVAEKVKTASTKDEIEEAIRLYDRATYVANDNKNSGKRKVSKDTMFRGFIQIASILLVLGYEKVDVITSKAFHLIDKGRV